MFPISIQYMICPIARIHRSKDQEVDQVDHGIVPLTINPSDPLGKFLLPVPVTLSSYGLETLVPGQGALLPGGVIDPDDDGEVGLLLHNGDKKDFLSGVQEILQDLGSIMSCNQSMVNYNSLIQAG